ncbi:MAG: DUF3072 domain-containing protein [Chitinophagaceae bacterium]|nr:DUF3072 domain-containing protein [Chitinophagaceae bacterium]
MSDNNQDKKPENLNENGTNAPAGSENNLSYKVKDPDEWITGSEPMTDAQKSYFDTLQGTPVDENLTKATAAKSIDEAKQKNASEEKTTASNAIKDPKDWVTGSEEMTDAQRSYLKTLSDEAGETVAENLSKASASERIEALQHQTGRGLPDEKKGETS